MYRGRPGRNSPGCGLCAFSRCQRAHSAAAAKARARFGPDIPIGYGDTDAQRRAGVQQSGMRLEWFQPGSAGALVACHRLLNKISDSRMASMMPAHRAIVTETDSRSASQPTMAAPMGTVPRKAS